ncbi:MAG: hypothetical protein MI864_19095 [Pseudomonadales bacterium]|nr:hypothetical protein [Pseudomonadales bacterium]
MNTILQIEDIETDLGGRILDDLKSKGWKVVSKYSPFAFDKGIDFDRYTLSKNGQRVEFEWDNWLEWKITGPEPVIKEIAREFSLTF